MADRIVIELDREEVEALITGNSPHFERAAKKLRAALASESVSWPEDMSGMKADAVVPESGEGEDTAGLREALSFLYGCNDAGSLNMSGPAYIATNYLLDEIARREGTNIDKVLDSLAIPAPEGSER